MSDNDPNASNDSGMSQRERRRQQHQANKPKVNLDKGDLKKWAGPAVLLLIVGGIVTAMVVTESTAPDCPGHWHAAFSVWVEEDRVPFNPDPSTGGYAAWGSAQNTWAAGTHIHGDDGVYHFHPAVEKCIAMEDGLQHLDVEVSEDALVLGQPHGPLAGTYDQASIRMFFQEWSAQDDTWNEVTDFADVLEAQPQNGDGLVIIYGDLTQEQIDGILERAPTMKGNPNYDPHYVAPGS